MSDTEIEVFEHGSIKALLPLRAGRGALVAAVHGVVSCHQCGRWGVVTRGDEGRLGIVWADPRVGRWVDLGCDEHDLRGEFCCGFDGHGAAMAWNGTRTNHLLLSGVDAVPHDSWIAKAVPAEDLE